MSQYTHLGGDDDSDAPMDLDSEISTADTEPQTQTMDQEQCTGETMVPEQGTNETNVQEQSVGETMIREQGISETVTQSQIQRESEEAKKVVGKGKGKGKASDDMRTQAQAQGAPGDKNDNLTAFGGEEIKMVSPHRKYSIAIDDDSTAGYSSRALAEMAERSRKVNEEQIRKQDEGKAAREESANTTSSDIQTQNKCDPNNDLSAKGVPTAEEATDPAEGPKKSAGGDRRGAP